MNRTSLQAPAIQRNAKVLENRRIGWETYRLRLEQPEIAAAILPGQFVMLRPVGRTDPLLARPFALYDTIDDDNGEPSAVDFVYLVMGNGTKALSRLQAGDVVDMWGPLGNTFPVPPELEPSQDLLIVAGGVGQTPFVALIKELLGRRQYGGRNVMPMAPENVSFVWGARSVDLLGGLEDFQQTGVDVKVATNDGSAGHRGYVTDLAEQAVLSDRPPAAVFGCGPEPMLDILAAVCARKSIPCWVSLETKMACGYGVCFSCVCPVVEPGGWDYRRVCLEGPVFPASAIHWPEMA